MCYLPLLAPIIESLSYVHRRLSHFIFSIFFDQYTVLTFPFIGSLRSTRNMLSLCGSLLAKYSTLDFQ